MHDIIFGKYNKESLYIIMKPALIIGSTCVDIIINLERLPMMGEDVQPISQTLTLGGCAFNVASTMRSLGANHTLISPVGTGIYGDFIAKRLKALGLPITVRLPEGENGCCYCFVDAHGERTFITQRGIEYTFQKTWMESYQSENYEYVYISGLEIEEKTGVQMIEYLEKNPKLKVFFAVGPRCHLIEERKRKRIYERNPVLHLNEQEALLLSGQNNYKDAATTLHSKTKNMVVITLAERGCYCLTKEKNELHIPASNVTNIVDSIGAGDSHAGALLSCLIKDIPLEQGLILANKVAATTLTVPGALLSREYLLEVLEL